MDLFYDLLACWAAAGFVTVVLLIGWFTRTGAVVAVSALLNVLAGSVLTLSFAYRLHGDPRGVELDQWVFLRLVAGTGIVLLVLAVWALLKLRWQDAERRRSAGPFATATRATKPVYDRAWLLSLLQQRNSGAVERVATDSASPSRPIGSRMHAADVNASG